MLRGVCHPVAWHARRGLGQLDCHTEAAIVHGEDPGNGRCAAEGPACPRRFHCGNRTGPQGRDGHRPVPDRNRGVQHSEYGGPVVVSQRYPGVAGVDVAVAAPFCAAAQARLSNYRRGDMTEQRDSAQLVAAAKQAAAFTWRIALGAALIESRRYAEAEDLYNALAAERPAVPAGLLGLARLMQRQRRWADALRHWDMLVGRPDAQVHPRWRVRRASVLMELGRFDDAEQELLASSKLEETRIAGMTGLALLAMRRAWWPEALH